MSSPEIAINFEYRFSPDQAKHAEALQRRRLLMRKYAEYLQIKAPEGVRLGALQLYPVERAGKSGSEVFYLDVYEEGINFPRRHIAKFQDVKSTNREYSAAHKANFVQITAPATKFVDAEANIGVLICDLAKVGNHCEFRNYFLSDVDSESCAQALASIFKEIGIRVNEGEIPKVFLEDFARYISRSSRPVERLRMLQQSSVGSLGIDGVARDILSTYERVSAEFVFDVIPCWTHGDLHARNLMVNYSEPSKTELIDFGWVHYGHPAKDFVLMEITLKFMLLHEYLADKTKLDKTSYHLPPSVYEAFEDYLCGGGMSLPTSEEFSAFVAGFEDLHPKQVYALERVYACIKVVRNSAASTLSEYCRNYYAAGFRSVEKHYFASMFLVALGLSSMAEMEPIWTLVGLSKIGARIWSEG